MQHQCSVNSCQFFLPPCPGWIISGLPSDSKHTAKSSILKTKRPSLDSSILPSQHPTSSHYVPAGIPSTLAVPFIEHFLLFLTPCKLASASPVLITTTIPPTPNPVPFLTCSLGHLPCIFFWPWAWVWQLQVTQGHFSVMFTLSTSMINSVLTDPKSLSVGLQCHILSCL